MKWGLTGVGNNYDFCSKNHEIIIGKLVKRLEVCITEGQNLCIGTYKAADKRNYWQTDNEKINYHFNDSNQRNFKWLVIFLCLTKPCRIQFVRALKKTRTRQKPTY